MQTILFDLVRRSKFTGAFVQNAPLMTIYPYGDLDRDYNSRGILHRVKDGRRFCTELPPSGVEQTQ